MGSPVGYKKIIEKSDNFIEAVKIYKKGDEYSDYPSDPDIQRKTRHSRALKKSLDSAGVRLRPPPPVLNVIKNIAAESNAGKAKRNAGKSWNYEMQSSPKTRRVEKSGESIAIPTSSQDYPNPRERRLENGSNREMYGDNSYDENVEVDLSKNHGRAGYLNNDTHFGSGHEEDFLGGSENSGCQERNRNQGIVGAPGRLGNGLESDDDQENDNESRPPEEGVLENDSEASREVRDVREENHNVPSTSNQAPTNLSKAPPDMSPDFPDFESKIKDHHDFLILECREGVKVVSRKWKVGKFFYYPPEDDQDFPNINTFVQEHRELRKSWEKHEIIKCLGGAKHFNVAKILGYFKKYKDGNTNRLESCKKKKRELSKRKFSSSTFCSSSAGDIPVIKSVPLFPKLILKPNHRKSAKGEVVEKKDDRKRQESISIKINPKEDERNGKKDQKKLSKKIGEKTFLSRESSFQPSTSQEPANRIVPTAIPPISSRQAKLKTLKKDIRIQESIDSMVTRTYYNILKINTNLYSLCNKFEDMDWRLHRIEDKIISGRERNESWEEQEEEFSKIFPLENLKDVNDFELQVENPNFYSALVKFYFRWKGGMNKMVNSIMRITLADRLGKKFNWTGRKGKEKFSDLKICKAMQSAVMKRFPDSAYADSEKLIKNWLGYKSHTAGHSPSPSNGEVNEQD